MAANGISTLTYKQQRQAAKLALAATDRASTGRKFVYDLTQLPTTYKPSDNDTADVVDNPNTGGLITGRPWTTSTILSEYDGTSLSGWTIELLGGPATSVEIDSSVNGEQYGTPHSSAFLIARGGAGFHRDFGSSLYNKTIQWDMRLGSQSSIGFIFGNNSAGNGANKYALRIREVTSNQAVSGFTSASSWGGIGEGSFTTTGINANQWVTIKVHLNPGANACKWFVNGVEQANYYTWTEGGAGNYHFGWVGTDSTINYIDNIYIFDGLV